MRRYGYGYDFNGLKLIGAIIEALYFPVERLVLRAFRLAAGLFRPR